MKAFIFDFDGVMVDSEIHWDNMSLSFYRKLMPHFTEELDQQLKGRSVDDIYQWLVEEHGAVMTKEDYMVMVNDLADHIYNTLAAPLPGLQGLIGRLQLQQIPMAIASSSLRQWIQPVLKRLELDHIFTTLVTAEDVGVGKPNPAVYLEAAKQLGVHAMDCIAIEDSHHGVTSAKAAGMRCIGLHHPQTKYVQDLSHADVVVNSLDEVTDGLLSRM